MNYIYTLGHWLAATVGSLLLYSAFFLYENEERAIQNKLVDWHTKLDAKGRTIVGSHKGLLSNAAIQTGLVIDKIFGRQILTLQNYFSTSCMACLSFFICGIISAWPLFAPVPWKYLWLSNCLYLIWAVSFLLLLLSPLANGFSKRVGLWQIIVIAATILFGFKIIAADKQWTNIDDIQAM